MNVKLTATISAKSPLFAGKSVTIFDDPVPTWLGDLASDFVPSGGLQGTGSVTVATSGGDVSFTASVSEDNAGFPPFSASLPVVTENVGVLGAWLVAEAIKNGNVFQVDLALTLYTPATSPAPTGPAQTL